MKIVDGKKFECIKCGECCKWEGIVILNDDDIDRLSDHFGKSPELIIKEYTKDDKGKKILINKSNSSECIFLKNNKCDIWEDKPKQCADFPIKYDKRCPGFHIDTRSASMSDKYELAVKSVSQKLSSGGSFDRQIVDGIFRNLQQTIKSASIVSVVSENGIDPFLSTNKMKVASLDDLFSFDRIGSSQLIHKCTRDLWTIDSDKDGNVQITRLFDNTGEPIKG